MRFFIFYAEGTIMRKVAILMGSDSDLHVCQKAADQLAKLNIPYTMHILSAHRTPAEASEFAKSARSEGYGVIIAAAGMAAHLAGAMAAGTVLPVIGIPIASGSLNGLDALLSTVQMPPGIPVATVAVNGAANAALLAAQILAVNDEELTRCLVALRKEQAANVLDKNAKLQQK
jgi:5-(carboxyamino)imidazole ribonucleotide mutase